MPKGPIQCQKVLLFLKKCQKKPIKSAKKNAKTCQKIPKGAKKKVLTAKKDTTTENAWKYNLLFVNLHTYKVDQKFTGGNMGQFTMSHVSWILQIHYMVTTTHVSKIRPNANHNVLK